MNSHDIKQHIKGTDLAMLRRILDSTEPPEGLNADGSDTRDAAARLLLALFEQGISTESALADALRARLAAPRAETRPPTKPAMQIGSGYRFGKRVERNGTWTIYHVFSGVPAEYASWKMVGLNVKTAERALRILNTPASVPAVS